MSDLSLMSLDKEFCPKSKVVNIIVGSSAKYKTSVDREAEAMYADYEPSLIHLTGADMEAARLWEDYKPSSENLCSVDREAQAMASDYEPHHVSILTSVDMEAAKLFGNQKPATDLKPIVSEYTRPEIKTSKISSDYEPNDSNLTSVDMEAAKIFENKKPSSDLKSRASEHASLKIKIPNKSADIEIKVPTNASLGIGEKSLSTKPKQIQINESLIKIKSGLLSIFRFNE